MTPNDEKEQQLFEEAVAKLQPLIAYHDFSKRDDGQYRNGFLREAYVIWKAGRAALRAESFEEANSTKVESEPVAWTTQTALRLISNGKVPIFEVSTVNLWGNKGVPLYTAPQTLPESKLVEVLTELIPITEEFVKFVDSHLPNGAECPALDKAKQALSEHRAQTLPIVEIEEP